MKRFFNRMFKRLQISRTITALENCSDKTLKDIGLERYQIRDYVNRMYS